MKGPIRPLIVAALLAPIALFPACHCADETDGIWTFEEYYDTDLPEDDAWQPDPDPDPVVDPDDWDWAFPDDEIDPDPPEWEETEWSTTTIEEGIPRTFASNDRTSVIIDRAGTVWLGYHRCYDPVCSEPILTVGYRRVDDTDFTWEIIEPHSGLFGLQSITANYPLAIYLDGVAGELKAAHRVGPSNWLIESLPVPSASAMDGFDVSRDGTRFFVSHAASSQQTIEFFSYNLSLAVPFWRRLEPLSPARSAAYERGLRGGNQMNFYLVHRDQWGDYRLSEYDLGTSQWTRSTERFPSAISSLLVRQNGRLCTAGPATGGLRLTCGTFDNPRQEDRILHGSAVYYLSSLIESRDQTLFIAYHDAGTQDLYVARRAPGQSWGTERVHGGETFGISTAVDHRDHLLMTYYHCAGSTCSLKLTERAP